MKKKKSSKSKYVVQPRKEQRYFSEEARKSIVAEIEAGHLSKAEAARKYNVSVTSIYNWLHKYCADYESALITITEHVSDSKKNKLLEADLATTYEKLGRSQAENMLLNKIIDIASEHFGMDLKKTFATPRLPNTSTTKKHSQ